MNTRQITRQVKISNMMRSYYIGYYDYLVEKFGDLVYINPVFTRSYSHSTLLSRIIASVKSTVDVENNYLQVVEDTFPYQEILTNFGQYVYEVEVDTKIACDYLVLMASINERRISSGGLNFEYTSISDIKIRKLSSLVKKCSILCYKDSIVDHPNLMGRISKHSTGQGIPSSVTEIAESNAKGTILSRINSISEKLYVACVENEEDMIQFPDGLVIKELRERSREFSILLRKFFRTDRYSASRPNCFKDLSGVLADLPPVLRKYLNHNFIKGLELKCIPVASPFEEE